MKKLVTILTLAAIAMTSMSAKSAQVQLKTSIKETPVSYELAYDGNVLEDGITEYAINIDESLTKDGDTEDFTIIASSNMNKDLAVVVRVSPDSFKTTLNNGKENFDSKITPDVNVKDNLPTVTAGLHKDLLVNRFNMSWNGNDQLPAGEYVSNVTISYTVE